MTIVTDPQALLAEQAAEVVGKLTEAQKRGLMPFALFSDAVGAALVRLGILSDDDGVFTHTQLGLACRAILIERQGK